MSATLARIHPSNPATSRGNFTHISTDPTGAKLVYCQARTVVIRPLSGSAGTLVYAQHAHPTTVARISPSGYYCASADAAGNVRVWDLVGDEQVLKLEIRALSGRITDLAWDGESKRIGVVGEGKDKFGHYFMIDSGSSCGEVTGHSKVANGIGFKRTRPFRAATASDDGNVIFYTGVPFKYQKTLNEHKGFIQALAYSQDGAHFATAGSDGRLVLYDGSSGDAIQPLTEAGEETAHRGTLFSCSFSADSKQLASCGADGVVRIWDVNARKLSKQFNLSGKNEFKSGSKADDQLVGCTFASKDDVVAALSLLGEITVIELKNDSSYKLLGATRSIAVNGLVRASGDSLLAGSVDGRVLSYTKDGGASIVGNSPSASAIVSLSSDADTVWVAAMDDTVRKVIGGRYDNFSIPTTGQPCGVASTGGRDPGLTVVATSAGLDLIQASGQSKVHVAVEGGVTAVAVSSNGKHVAAGRGDGKVLLYAHEGGSANLRQQAVLDSGRSAITALAFSPQGTLLAAGESNGKINVYDVDAQKVKYNQWVFHTARINAVQFSPDGTHAVSASLDTNVYVWSTLRPMKSIAIKNAFAGGANGACWLDDDTIGCAGADGSAKVYTIKRHA